MNRTETRETQLVPLQKANGSWINEPGYGGSTSAWDAFDATITVGLKELEAKYPGHTKTPTSRNAAAVETTDASVSEADPS